ncbi:hypothetical protein E8E11_010287 [Didymella keratinophila]|nr:hypothetical protein E8E11_010287 [Didymella keratinophila]
MVREVDGFIYKSSVYVQKNEQMSQPKIHHYIGSSIMSASKKCKTDGLDGDAAVHVTVNKNGTASAFLDDQYAVFPKALQAIVANQIIEMNFFNETTEPARYTVSSHDSSTYESFEAEHVMHERTQETPKKSPKHRSMGFANLAAMVSFMESGLVGGEADEEGWIRTAMSQPFNKRAAAEPAEQANPKKQRTASAKTMEAEEEYESIQITTDLHGKFDPYPKALRQRVEDTYGDDVYKILEAFASGGAFPKKYTFHIVRGSRVQDGNASDYKSTQIETYYSASMANVAVLEQFLKIALPRKADFVKAPDVELINPDFAALHSVPPGHMGWGFDALGCLSLHKTIILKNKLKHAFAYVQRKDVISVTID